MSDTPTTTSMKESSSMEKRMGKEFTHGLMGRFMTESGREESRRVMECGKVSLEIPTLVNGRTARQMAMECIHGRMETGMRESGGTVSSMGKALTSLPIRTPTQGSTSLGSQTGLVSINGRTAALTLGSSRMDSNMGRGNGRRWEAKLIATAMRESMCRIRRMGMGCSTGRVATSIRETTRRMRGTAMERCTGLMVHATKELGNWGFSMDKAKWCFQMALSRKASLKTMSSLALALPASSHPQWVIAVDQTKIHLTGLPTSRSLK